MYRSLAKYPSPSASAAEQKTANWTDGNTRAGRTLPLHEAVIGFNSTVVVGITSDVHAWKKRREEGN
jgi:hypothetical protein